MSEAIRSDALQGGIVRKSSEVRGRRVISHSDPELVAKLRFALCRAPMRFRVGKLDADAMGALANLGAVPHYDEIIIVNGIATYEERMDPGIVCVECGDGGPNCVDHHRYSDAGASSATKESATRQSDALAAFLSAPQESARRALNEYLHHLDAGEFHLLNSEGAKGVYPALIHLISGMQESIGDPIAQYEAFLRIRQAVLQTGLNPFTDSVHRILPLVEGSRQWLRAKERGNLELKALGGNAKRFYCTNIGHILGVIVTDLPSAPREMQNTLVPGTTFRPDIVVAISPKFILPAERGLPEEERTPVRKYTITSRKDREGEVISVAEAGASLDLLEKEFGGLPGWGGPLENPTIIGSPMETGSSIPLMEVIDLMLADF